jgi:RNA polymerase sigma-70 factor (ECF subfamily)
MTNDGRDRYPEQEGDRPIDEVVPSLYDELHRIASRMMAREKTGHTLQTTALVHEAYLRLARDERINCADRAQFAAIVAGAIRRVLIDHARRKNRQKAGGDWRRVDLGGALANDDSGDVDLLALDEAMESLAQRNPHQARIVELRFFGGLTIEETAGVLEISTSTVEREWRYARAVLYRALEGDPA